MLTSWLLYATELGVLLCLVALLLERLARWRAAPARGVWIAAVAVMVIAPSALSIRPAPARQSPSVHAPRGGFPARAEWLDTPLSILWLLASALLASRLVGTGFALRRRRRRWTAAELDGKPVLLSSELGPAVVGWRRFAIVIPKWALDFDESSRALMLAHEAEHAGSGDPYLRSAAALALVLMPWNPAIWWATRRMRLAIEIDCDQRVLGRGVDPHRYASLLLAVAARRAGTSFVWATALSGSGSSLTSRILAMTSPFRPRHPRLALLGIGTAIGAVVVIACESPMPGPLAPSRTVQADTAYLTLRVDSPSATEYVALTVTDAETGKPMSVLVRDPAGAERERLELKVKKGHDSNGCSEALAATKITGRVEGSGEVTLRCE